jgi:hypothetical protein
MDRLDLSGLTDDQLVALARLLAEELSRRSDAVAAAAMDATDDVRAMARAAQAAAEAEAVRLRDGERQRAAAEAAAAVRRKAHARPAAP